MEFDLIVPVDVPLEELPSIIARRCGSSSPYRILRQSLDARKKPALFWNYRIAAGEFQDYPDADTIIPVAFSKNNRSAVVVGSGPAGFFAADILSRAGFSVSLLEKGPAANVRHQDICDYEEGGELKDNSNYACGEGGAGTFSDGKLTSRTKGISREKKYISSRYVEFGAPEDILWQAYPHVGSDRLYHVVQKGRKKLQSRGVEFHFNTEVTGLLKTGDGRCTGVSAGDRDFPADITILAPGHSAFSLFRHLLKQGAVFEPKGFAVGFRIEHPRELINISQWGRSGIPGIKAAEYRLTGRSESGRGVYSFCMCPGGKVVPAAWRRGINIVNGVSMFRRDGKWSNSAIVASVHPGELFPGAKTPLDILGSLEELEERAWALTGPHSVPAATPRTLLEGDRHGMLPDSSFPFIPEPADYSLIYPDWLLSDLNDGLVQFNRRIKGFDTGLILGVETTTSASLKILRSSSGEVENIPGLYLAGEGSGSAGGIMSSAVDGIKTALALVAG